MVIIGPEERKVIPVGYMTGNLELDMMDLIDL